MMNDLIIQKKRGRKPKILNQSPIQVELVINSNFFIEESQSQSQPKVPDSIQDHLSINRDTLCNYESPILEEEIIIKKRGRKPKGGKIIQQTDTSNDNKLYKQNIILHLKCTLKDLETDTNSNVECYNLVSNKETYEKLECTESLSKKYYIDSVEEDTTSEIDVKNDIRDIWDKLKQLEYNLHTNNINNKKSACFWCTYDFDNPPIYIPKHYIDNTYHVYGCFCSPECATSYLMKENIDTSAKFERYHLLNHIYCKIYEYNKNINPAPNPYYTLEKYYGNLTIQEYRLLLKNERLFLVVDKPLTRILPELHEDNDDFSINNKIITSNAYKIKKKDCKTLNKNTILTSNFGSAN
jgi:hypothetical protein